MAGLNDSSFVERLREKRKSITPSDPWTGPLRNLRGQTCYDGVERVATDAVFEKLDLPRLKRTPEAAKRLKGLMVELGWTPVRARAVTTRGRAARVRGYARMKQSVQQEATEDGTIKPSNR
jgi:hypothetical protein